jgi:hypothetical protein
VTSGFGFVGAPIEQVTLASVSCQSGGDLELRAGFGMTSEFLQKVAAHAGQKVVALELPRIPKTNRTDPCGMRYKSAAV